MTFSTRYPEQTTLYHYLFRITDDFSLEQFVTVINHKQTGSTPIGLSEFWKPVCIDGKPIRVYEFSEDYSIIMVLVKGVGGYRNVLGNGKFSVDENGFLLAELAMFDGLNTTLSVGYVMNGQNCLRVLH